MSDANTCSIEDCGRPKKSRGWCSIHYSRWRAHGDPHIVLNQSTAGKTCTVDDCGDPVSAKGLCQHHYNRNRYTGAPTDGARRPRYDTPQESFAARTRWKGDCLVWTGTIYPAGYGEISTGGGNKRLVHRWAWEERNGPIPEGMQIDHMCHNRACVNADHLRLATPKQNLENMLRGNSGSVAGGIRGVAWDESRGKWMATVGHNGTMTNLGRYDSKEIAAAVALGARLALFKYNLADRAILDMTD